MEKSEGGHFEKSYEAEKGRLETFRKGRVHGINLRGRTPAGEDLKPGDWGHVSSLLIPLVEKNKQTYVTYPSPHSDSHHFEPQILGSTSFLEMLLRLPRLIILRAEHADI